MIFWRFFDDFLTKLFFWIIFWRFFEDFLKNLGSYKGKLCSSGKQAASLKTNVSDKKCGSPIN